MSLEALLDLMENSENPEEALKEHIAKQRSNSGNVNKNTCVTNKSLQNNEVTAVTPRKIQTLPKNTIRNNDVTPVTPVTPKKTLSEKNLVITTEQINKIRTWLNHIGEPENDHHIVINRCRSDPEALAYYLKQADDHATGKRREKVLKMLSDHPNQKRAYATDAETDPDNVILTCAIRGMCTFEVLISKDKYDPFVLMDVLHKDLIH